MDTNPREQLSENIARDLTSGLASNSSRSFQNYLRAERQHPSVRTELTELSRSLSSQELRLILLGVPIDSGQSSTPSP